MRVEMYMRGTQIQTLRSSVGGRSIPHNIGGVGRLLDRQTRPEGGVRECDARRTVGIAVSHRTSL